MRTAREGFYGASVLEQLQRMDTGHSIPEHISIGIDARTFRFKWRKSDYLQLDDDHLLCRQSNWVMVRSDPRQKIGSGPKRHQTNIQYMYAARVQYTSELLALIGSLSD